MAIDKKLILKLREASNAGFADCKAALEANDNNLEASIDWLRKKGVAKALNKSALREYKEGGTWVKKDDFGVAVLELNSETDFTARNEHFCSLADEILDVILQNKTSDINEIFSLKLKDGNTVEDSCSHLTFITGEKIVLKRVKYLALSNSESASCYRHSNGKISTAIILDKKLKDEDIKGLSMHYAANNPKFIDHGQIDESWLESEKNIIVSLLKKENKPEQFHDRIVAERLKKVCAQSVFVDQDYLFDNSKTVGEILNTLGAKIKNAVYFELGG